MQAWHPLFVRFLAVVVGVAGLLFWFVSLTRMAEEWDRPIAEISFGRDLRALMVAGELAAEREGSELYDPESRAYSAVDAAEFLNPPWFAIAMVPLSLVPFHVAFVTWTLAGIGLLGFTLRRMQLDHWGALAGAVLLTFAAIICVWYGQSSFVMVAVLALGAGALLSERLRLAGVLFALLAFKPHLLLGFVVLWLVRLRQWWMAVAAAAAATALMFLLAELWMPGSTSAFVERIIQADPAESSWRKVSIFALGQLLLGSSNPIGTAVAAAIAVMLAVWFALVVWQSGMSNPVAIALAIVVSLLIAPKAVAYDWLLLVVAFGLLVKHSGITPTSLALPSLLLAASLVVGFSLSDRITDALGFTIHLPPIVLLGVFGWLMLNHATVGGSGQPVEAAAS